MTARGFAEAQAMYQHSSTAGLIGEVRRFGAHGPAYEVVDTAANGDVVICVIESGERLSYPRADLLADPLAETVP